MLFPTPGSPPIRIKVPLTIPPPNTRATSVPVRSSISGVAKSHLSTTRPVLPGSVIRCIRVPRSSPISANDLATPVHHRHLLLYARDLFMSHLSTAPMHCLEHEWQQILSRHSPEPLLTSVQRHCSNSAERPCAPQSLLNCPTHIISVSLRKDRYRLTFLVRRRNGRDRRRRDDLGRTLNSETPFLVCWWRRRGSPTFVPIAATLFVPAMTTSIEKRRANDLTSSIVLHIQTQFVPADVTSSIRQHLSSLHQHSHAFTIDHSMPHFSLFSQGADVESTVF